MCNKFSSFVVGAALGAAATYFGATKEGRSKVVSWIDAIKAFVAKPEDENQVEDVENEDL